MGAPKGPEGKEDLRPTIAEFRANRVQQGLDTTDEDVNQALIKGEIQPPAADEAVGSKTKDPATQAVMDEMARRIIDNAPPGTFLPKAEHEKRRRKPVGTTN